MLEKGRDIMIEAAEEVERLAGLEVILAETERTAAIAMSRSIRAGVFDGGEDEVVEVEEEKGQGKPKKKKAEVLAAVREADADPCPVGEGGSEEAVRAL